jgi:hypothetical protein
MLHGEHTSPFPSAGQMRIRSLQSLRGGRVKYSAPIGASMDSTFRDLFGAERRYPSSMAVMIQWLSRNTNKTLCELGMVADLLYVSKF